MLVVPTLMGLINDFFRIKRKTDKFVDTVEKLEQSTHERQLATARSQYYRGQLTAREYEQKVKSKTGSHTAPIRLLISDISGIGESTSTAIVREYDSVEEFEKTDKERLTSIRGIGESTADAILERIHRP